MKRLHNDDPTRRNDELGRPASQPESSGSYYYDDATGYEIYQDDGAEESRDEDDASNSHHDTEVV